MRQVYALRVIYETLKDYPLAITFCVSKSQLRDAPLPPTHLQVLVRLREITVWGVAVLQLGR